MPILVHKERFYNKCWGSEAERLSYTNIFAWEEKRVEHRREIH